MEDGAAADLRKTFFAQFKHSQLQSMNLLDRKKHKKDKKDDNDKKENEDKQECQDITTNSYSMLGNNIQHVLQHFFRGLLHVDGNHFFVLPCCS